MTTNDDESSPQNSRLSEAERAAAFTKHQPVDRAAAFRAGRTPIPPKFIMWMVAVFAVLGLGGAVIEHYFGSIGIPTTSSTVFKLSPTPKTPAGAQISAALPALMGLKYIANAKAPGFSLLTQTGTEWSLRDARDEAIVLTFENSTCNDICPVLGAELKQAQQRLGAKASRVLFVIVNTDPRHVAVTPAPAALTVAGLDGAPNVLFLTSKLARLNAVWTNYGVSVRVGSKANQIMHNDIMYFISPAGQLSAQATPFANENTRGIFSLSPTDISRFAQGIANTAGSLVK